MAQIYPVVAATDNACILNSRESLIYPFSFGSWTELRFGFYLSTCTASAPNIAGESEQITIGTASSNTWFAGFKDSQSNSFPLQTGCVFLGMGSITGHGDAQFKNNNAYGNSIQTNLFYSSGNGNYFYQDYPGVNLHTTTGTEFTGYQVAYNGIKLTVANVGTTNQTFSLTHSYDSANANASGINIATLRQSLRTFANPSTTLTGFYTLNTGIAPPNTFPGAPIPLPDAVFIYSPFYNSRMRVHSIVVEQYA